MFLRIAHRRVVALLLLVALSFTLAPVALASGSVNTIGNLPVPVLPVAGAPPVFDEDARRAELAQRRARVAERIGPNSVLVLFGGEPRVYTNDVDYKFRQENNLFYLTHLKQKGATLVLMPGHTQFREVLFLPKRNPARETWTGHMYSPAEAALVSGISEIWDAEEFDTFMRELRRRRPYRPKGDRLLRSVSMGGGSSAAVTPPVPKTGQTVQAANAATPARPVTGNSGSNLVTTNSQTAAASSSVVRAPAADESHGYERLFDYAARHDAALYLLIPNQEDDSEYRMEQRFAAQWAQVASGFNLRNASPIFADLRLRKSSSELQLLQHAIDITAEGFGRAMAVAGRVNWEYEVEAEIDYTFKRRNADNWGYPSIVGCGPNATTLHYEESQSRVNKGDLLLMDVGAEYNHYTADVTRTFPVNGKFTGAQADIYNIVLAAQDAGMRAVRPGATLSDVHNAAREVIKDGLLRLGLITDRNSNQDRIWFMHGTSHWLGMNVHDVGGRGDKLEPNMVFTIEPGIYIREDALDNLEKTPENARFIQAVRPAFEKYKNIGVRIEDDVVVTANGYRNMSSALPRTIPDIEAFIARGAQELRVSAFDLQRHQRASAEFLNVRHLLGKNLHKHD